MEEGHINTLSLADAVTFKYWRHYQELRTSPGAEGTSGVGFLGGTDLPRSEIQHLPLCWQGMDYPALNSLPTKSNTIQLNSTLASHPEVLPTPVILAKMELPPPFAQ
ncbi:hypothetical protein E2C01_042742 [Portunus trituberculatus]|uniref:Uncharacterized protein n=1 Tax=Portunus trituberculatus TaxID=210409 RepID=A0A5B7FUD5_PORTR|nr:hypothetical protein [Portunus trituberculatus]